MQEDYDYSEPESADESERQPCYIDGPGQVPLENVIVQYVYKALSPESPVYSPETSPGIDLAYTDNDFSNITTALMSEDPVSQEAVYRAMERLKERDDEEQRFRSAPSRAVRLSTLKGFYESGNHCAAVRLLGSRHHLVIDNKYIKRGTDCNTAWDATSRGALDFLVCVPDQPGFQAALPNPPHGTTWEWQMDFTQPQKEFKAKHAHLGFDPAGSMLYIGRCNGEELWAAWAPLDFFDDRDYQPVRARFSSGDTRLSSEMYRWTTIFMVYVLEQLGVSNITLLSPHPCKLDNLDDVRRQTNLM
jgi:hypothetical protein